MAALAVHHPEQALPDDVIAMTNAAAAMRCGDVTLATELAETSAGPARPGDLVGVVEGKVVAVGTDVCVVSMGVLRLMLRGTDELLTLVAGESLADSDVDALTAAVRAAYPLVHIEPHRGEQTGAALLMGVE
jgi:dihydroxyacetone kinase-like predicted kinase